MNSSPNGPVRRLVIFGDRTATEILETAQLTCVAEFDSIEKHFFNAEDFVATATPLEANGAEVFFHVGIAETRVKHEILQHVVPRGWKSWSILHPTAVVAPSAILGQGVFVGPLAVVSSHAQIGDHCLIHLSCSIGHDAVIEKHSAILPGARVSGKVRIGEATIIGSNAFVAPSVHIGSGCRVDALTYASRDLPDNHIVSCRAKSAVRRFL